MDQNTIINIPTDRLADIAMDTVRFYVPGRFNNIPEILDTKEDFSLCGRYLAKTIELQSQFSYYELFMSSHKKLVEQSGGTGEMIDDIKDKIDIFTNLSNIMYNTNAALSRLGTFKELELTYLKIAGLGRYTGNICSTSWEGPSSLRDDELINMPLPDLLNYMHPKYLFKMPTELDSPDKLRSGGQLMIRCVVMYDYYLMLSIKARRKKRHLKKECAGKDLIHDEIQREKLLQDFSKEMIRAYKTISRLATLEQFSLEEYKMIESKHTEHQLSSVI